MKDKDEEYRILTPPEYQAMLKNVPSNRPDVKMSIQTLFNTGMRYSEFRRFVANPQWFSYENRVINLPAQAAKTKRGRGIQLTPAFAELLNVYLLGSSLYCPTQSYNIVINHLNGISEKAGIGWQPTIKTLRKTIVTYLVFNQPRQNNYSLIDVFMSMGHKQNISIEHYLGQANRLKNYKEQVAELVKGWGE